MKAVTTIRNDRFRLKYLAIQKAFKHKYNVEGKRYDRILKELEDEFFLSKVRLGEILRLELD